jgi:hypothetical protein
MRRCDRNPAQRLRAAVEALPVPTREAMLRGMASNPIVAGAYLDRDSGGICPMLAAHRNGGRTNLASFARAWDRYTGATRPRLASGRELLTLRSLLESSLTRDGVAEPGSIAAAAAQIRAGRVAIAESDVPPPERRPRDSGERNRTSELRGRTSWSWLRPARRYEEFRELLAAAEEQLADQRAAGLLERRRPVHLG